MSTYAVRPAGSGVGLWGTPPYTCGPQPSSRGIAMDSLLIPPDPASWYVWDQQTTVLNRERIGEDGMSPILPFQPVCCFCHAHEMGCDLRIKVRGHRNAGSTSYRRCTQPARHAPDAHQVGHDEVPGPGDDRLIQYARAVVV